MDLADDSPPARARAAFAAFADTPLAALLDAHAREDPAPRLLALFHRAAARVPAYGAFLREHRVDPARVGTLDDFRALPLTTKADYFRRYPLAERCYDGRLSSSDMVAVSSGSTGEPTIWPRSVADEYAVATRFEHVFRDAFDAHRRTTLAVVCFPLGTWVGGMYTAACCRHLAAKGYPLTVVAPGNNPAEIARAVTELGPLFDQVVLLGYPPFLKDVVDGGRVAGVDWARYRIKLVLAGEVFSEEWRALMAERTGMTSPERDTAALYGTADAGVLGNETALTVRIRRYLAAHADAAHALFGEARLPTLVQYDPHVRYFETRDGTLLFSADGGVPLVRYHLADQGGLVPFDAMKAFLRARGFDPFTDDVGPTYALPFVYVFGRSHFAVSFYGANVFPEMISVGLEQPAVKEHVTGKFVMEVTEDAGRDRTLVIAVELAHGAAADEGLGEAVAASIAGALLRLNSEYAGYVPAARRTPRVTLWPRAHPEYFPTGVKHRYSR